MNDTIQIFVFAVIAGLILFQLYRVLGRRVGRQPEEDARAKPAAARGEAQGGEARPAFVDPHLIQAAAGLKASDPAFDPQRFLDGARQAYETIVRAFAANDRETLKPLLAPSVAQSFEAAMAAREAEGRKETVEFAHPPRADLESTQAEGQTARATVRFLAELRSRLSDQPDAAEEHRRTAELWTFERNLAAADPNWVLSRVQAAQA